MIYALHLSSIISHYLNIFLILDLSFFFFVKPAFFSPLSASHKNNLLSSLFPSIFIYFFFSFSFSLSFLFGLALFTLFHFFFDQSFFFLNYLFFLSFPLYVCRKLLFRLFIYHLLSGSFLSASNMTYLSAATSTKQFPIDFNQ